MLLSEIYAKAEEAVKGTWKLNDGTYAGKITGFKLVKENTCILLKIHLDEDIIFMNCTALNRYTREPLIRFIEPFEHVEEVVGKMFEITIVNNTSKSGKMFSNITRVKYLHD